MHSGTVYTIKSPWCIVKEHCEPFPKDSSRQKHVKIDINKNVRTIQISRHCGLSDFIDDMVGCNVMVLVSHTIH